MGANAKYVLVTMALLLVGGAVGSASASAVEAPYWKVKGTRLVSGQSEKTSIKLKKEIVLNGMVLGKKIEVKCKSVSATKAEIIGSNETFDGKAAFTLFPKECKLFVNFGEGFVEQKGCEVSAFETTPLTGRLWYEGKKEEHETIVAVFDPELEKTALAKVTVKKIEVCEQAGTYELKGAFGAKVTPKNSEALAGLLVAPAVPIRQVWQPQTTEERTLALEFAGSPATIEFEAEITLTSGFKFGAFSV